MDRRAFLHTLAAATLLAVPLAAEAQPAGKVYRIGYLTISSAREELMLQPLLKALHDLGYVEGRHLVIEPRYADGEADRLPALAAELVQRKLDLIVAISTPATLATQQATTTVPVVFALAADPVQSGFVAGLGRPGRNLTGYAAGLYHEKQLEILKESVPRVSRVACLCPGPSQSHIDAARVLGVQLQVLGVRGPDDFDKAFESALRGRTAAA